MRPFPAATSRPAAVVAVAASVALAAGALVATPAAARTGQGAKPTAAPRCGVFFDDFHYTGHTDPRLAAHGWTLRDDQGGPGPKGAYWRADNISFPREHGEQSMQLTLTSDGTPAGTTQAEVSTTQEKFWEGTYLARIKFSDTPASGADGDRITQTFFAISPLAFDGDPLYSETDFAEYLPNGGWGSDVPIDTQTTWYTTGDDISDNVETEQKRSLDGWHDIMATVAQGHVKYYVDGELVGDHAGKFYPRQAMAVDFNQWVIDITHHVGTGTSTYHEKVDYVLHVQDRALSPRQADSQVRRLRSVRVSHLDTVRSGTCSR
ncbi:glycoside hydrolase family 16 protein [Actinacidiphila alni]|uniref:glycoside hydrolase family 16 protein n=1 Tax=Actinacidiphila alni TaxID=380248 RepID=UPI003455FCAE